jgi:glycosyltransferase involved in cell wall biosynthesis
MNERLFIQLCEILLSIAAIGGIAIIFAATLYDLRAITQKKALQLRLNTLDKSRQPTVAIVVYAYNNDSTIVECMNSIGLIDYQNYSVVVINNASTDATRQTILKYKQNHKNFPLRLVSTRKFTDRLLCLRLGHGKVPRSGLTLILSASDTFPPASLKESVAHFLINNTLEVARLRPYNNPESNIALLPHYFTRLSRNMFDKVLSLHTLSRFNYDDSGIVIRSYLFLENTFPRKALSTYLTAVTFKPTSASALKLDCKQTSPYAHLIDIAKIITSLLIIAMVSYFFYTAAILQSNILLTLSWLAVGLWLVAIIWSDDVMNIKSKIELSVTVPFMYFLIYIYLILNVLHRTGQCLMAIKLPKINFESIHDTIQLELYSTRY